MKGKLSQIWFEHNQELQTSGISRALAIQSGIRSLSAEKTKRLLGFSVGPGWGMPLKSISGDGIIWQIKPDVQILDADGKLRKYVTPLGSKSRFIVPPSVEPVLKNVSIPLFITEGVKKTLCGVANEFQTIGLLGVWNFLSDHEPIQDFKFIDWRGRNVYIAFDNDALSKESVHQAQLRLALELENRQAIVRIIGIPMIQENSKTGMDDFIVSRGKDAFAGLIKIARPLVDYEIEAIALRPRDDQDLAIEWLLRQIAHRVSPLRLEEFIDQICRQLGRRVGAVRAQLRQINSRPVLDSDDLSSEALNRIRQARGLTQDEKFRMISQAIYRDLGNNGRLIHAPAGIFYLENASGNLMEIESSYFVSYCQSKYETNSSTAEWRFIKADLQGHTVNEGIRADVRHFNFFNGKRRVLYVTASQNEMWRLDGMKIARVPIGTDDVFLLPGTCEPVEPVFKNSAKWDQLVCGSFPIDPAAGMPLNIVTLLLKVWFWSIFFDLPARPILSLIGPKGSGKTTMAKLLGKVLLGDGFDVQNIPEKNENTETLFINRPLAALDNIDSTLPPRVLDLLATASTGAQVSRRELYTTSNLKQLKMQAYIILTSRRPRFLRDDIVDRLLSFSTRRIENFHDAIVQTVVDQRPHLWGELLKDLNRIVRQLRMGNQSTRIGQYRMSDFVNFGLKAVPVQQRAMWREALEALDFSRANLENSQEHWIVQLRDWVGDGFLKMRQNVSVEVIKAKISGSISDISLTQLGKRLNDPNHSLRTWIAVERRFRGGRSFYTLNLTKLGRRSWEAERGGGLGGRDSSDPDEG